MFADNFLRRNGKFFRNAKLYVLAETFELFLSIQMEMRERWEGGANRRFATTEAERRYER